MRKIGEILPILVASGILLAGNGLQGTLIAVRANLEGFDASVIGLSGTTYYLGFRFGCRYAPHRCANVGHI
ncbi:MAG: MFS transporter, partial [Pseudomonadota bacterium]